MTFTKGSLTEVKYIDPSTGKFLGKVDNYVPLEIIQDTCDKLIVKYDLEEVKVEIYIEGGLKRQYNKKKYSAIEKL